MRKIKQTKKKLAAEGQENGERLAKILLDSRIDLYYILVSVSSSTFFVLFLIVCILNKSNTPKHQNTSHYTQTGPTSPTNQQPNLLTPAEKSRAKLRDEFRQKLEKGVLQLEAEGGDLGIEGEEDVGSGTKRARGEGEEEEVEIDPSQAPAGVEEESVPKKKKKDKKETTKGPTKDKKKKQKKEQARRRGGAIISKSFRRR